MTKTPPAATASGDVHPERDMPGSTDDNGAGAPRPDVPTPVRAVAMHIVTRLAAATIADVWARYDLGKIAHALRYEPSLYSAHTLANLAQMLAMHPSGLRKYARVAEMIPPSELAGLLDLRDRLGSPLTWSHIEKLADARSPSVRRKLALQVVEQQLSVRELAIRLRSPEALRGGRR